MSVDKSAISQNLDTDFLKLIAAAAMCIDHFGKIFSPEIIIFQIIGRISFPIFAYCVVVGFLYTRDIKKYMLRLLLFAVITQPFYIQAFAPGAHEIYVYVLNKNILFTLLTGLIAIYGFRERNWFVFAAAILFSVFGGIDYGPYGVVLIVIFYMFRDNYYASLFIVAMFIAAQFLHDGTTVDILGFEACIRGFGIFSLPFIYCKTNFGLRINKYFFYVFYPAHFLVFSLLQML